MNFQKNCFVDLDAGLWKDLVCEWRVRSKEIEMKVKAEGIVELFYFISTDFSYQTENLPDVYSLMMMKT